MGKLSNMLKPPRAEISPNSMASFLKGTSIEPYNPTLQDRAYEVFGLRPDVERGNLLPIPTDDGVVAPEWVNSLAKSFLLPSHVMQGGRYNQQDVTNMAMDITPASVASSLATPAKAGFTDIGMGKVGYGGNSGYISQSRSVRATNAMDEGRDILSRSITKLKEIAKENGIDLDSKKAQELLERNHSGEWHHTGMYAKKTNYYDPIETAKNEFGIGLNQDDINDLTQEYLLNNRYEMPEAIKNITTRENIEPPKALRYLPENFNNKDYETLKNYLLNKDINNYDNIDYMEVAREQLKPSNNQKALQQKILDKINPNYDDPVLRKYIKDPETGKLERFYNPNLTSEASPYSSKRLKGFYKRLLAEGKIDETMFKILNGVE